MKSIISAVIAIFIISGCSATDALYQTGKVIYVGGKKVVIANSDLLDEETLKTLSDLDDKAGRYDEARDIVKTAVGKDANSSN